jgi:3-oxoadipate enol-lactonase
MAPEICVTGSVPDGTAPNTLLLHSLAMDRSLWDDHLPMFDETVRVARCDLPGHGRSCDLESTSIEEMADLVAEWIAPRTEGPITVVGLSLGGCVAQALTIRHPDLVGALVLVDTTAWYGEGAPEAWAGRAQKAADKGFGSLAQFQLDRWFGGDFAGENPEVAERLLEVFAANDITSYTAVCHAMGAMDLRDTLPTISVPTTVLVGEHDPATPVPMAEDLVTRIADAELRVIPGSGHLSPIESPKDFIAAVQEAVASV